MALLVNIIGAGHLGQTIGHLLVKHQLVLIGGVCNTSAIKTTNAIKFIGEGSYCPSINELPAADLTFITTPDDLISTLCEALSKNKSLKPGSTVLHCNLTSDTLLSVKEKGCYVASVHPMRSFAKPELSVAQYNGTYCAMEGDKEALSIVSYLFNSIGSITYPIDKSKKSLYHAAGVFASNYLVTLSQQALFCLTNAGIEHEMAMQVITNIMKGTVANLERTLSPEQSLTGPIQRGDTSTIKKHLASLTDTTHRELYSSLGKTTLSLTSHDEKLKRIINDALNMDEDIFSRRFAVGDLVI